MTGDLVVITHRPPTVPAGSDTRRFMKVGRLEGTPSPEQATRFDRREAECMLANGYLSTLDARIEDAP